MLFDVFWKSLEKRNIYIYRQLYARKQRFLLFMYFNIRREPRRKEREVKIPIFPGKYHQNCGFSMTMLVSGSVTWNLKEYPLGKRRNIEPNYQRLGSSR